MILGIGIIFLTAILVLSLLSPNQAALTRQLALALWQVFGWGGVVVPVLLGGLGFYLVLWGMDQAPALPRFRLSGLLLLFVVFEALASLVAVSRDNGLATVTEVAEAMTGGGYFGGFIAWVLAAAVGRVGAALLLGLLGVISAILLFGVTRADAAHFIAALWARRPQRSAVTVGDRAIPINTPALPAQRRPGLRLVADEAAGEASETPITVNRTAAAEPERAKETAKPHEDDETVPAPMPVFISDGNGVYEQSWELPELDKMLEAGGDQEISNATIREQVEVIEHTLDSFGAPAKVVEINQGPTVTQFGVEPQFIERRNGKRTKVKVGKIASLADDLALALAAHSVRVEAPVPGKGYVGLEVPNPQKALVSLSDVMQSPAFTRLRSSLRIGLGQNVSGQAVAADLGKMPHLLIAGATGSGKSVCVNSIIACLLLQNTPEQLRMVMVDPKRVELTGYNGIPHLVAPVVVDMERVIATLQWALREMDNRYQQLAELGARNIDEYNKKIVKHKRRPLPHVVIFIDELADLMMVSPEDTERSVTRLAQMARATGIHMVIATQRPSVDVVTGLIKANFPARVAFAVASGTDSRVILDATGAERLLGQGDMLFQSPDAGAPVRLQGAFVSDYELTRVIDYWKSARRFRRISHEEAQRQAETPLRIADEDSAQVSTVSTIPPPTQQPLWEDLIEQEAEAPDYEDELVPEAIALVRDLGKASTSLLQRRFRIGYTRASRIMDVMEAEGIIGPPTGTSKAREVLPAETPAEDGDEGQDSSGDLGEPEEHAEAETTADEAEA
ncbi:MAG: DNA translocase FtsK 4TM domain-containing protein [Anaerolineae bacterium]|nr:DNA translocase FtsK 4TM domain-containing protein [Anaerolineae bacterium]